ncbi:MAG: carbohydrate ABC transporter permease [Ruminococcus sp.]|nr:carbohydrate ABC transporter permease [Ruminococcus sp.]
MATKKEEKEFEKERKKEQKERLKRMKEEGLDKYFTPEQIRYNRNKRLIGTIWPIFRALILFGLGFVIMYPLLFMLSTAFRPNDQMSDPSIVWLPKSFTIDNIETVANLMRFTTWDWSSPLTNTLLNTIIINIVSSVLQVFTCSITGYGFARFKFKGRGILFGVVLMMIIVPPQIITIPLYMQYAYFKLFGLIPLYIGGSQVSLINSGLTMYLPALFANGIKAGLFIYIFRQFFRGLPKELEDAAYLDGCGPFETYVKIMVPNAKTSFLTVFLFSIVWYWNDYYVSASFFTQNNTVALMLKNLDSTLQQELFDGESVSARQMIVWLESGCLLSITPLLIMYIFLQRYFIEGVERSGLTGM